MNDELKCEEIVPVLKQDFGALWKCRQRGNTLEVITPFSTATQKFVSVFITSRDKELIVTEGGWLEGDGDFYGLAQDTQEEEYRVCQNHFAEAFGISITANPGGGRVFFKKCEKLSLLAGAVYDVGSFVSSVVNCTSMRESDNVEIENKLTFRKEANEFIAGSFLNARFHQAIDGLERIKFNAVLVYPSAVSLVCYVTGSTPYYFSSDLRRAIINFELANASRSSAHIKSRIALLNNSAAGYERGRSDELLGLLGAHKGRAVTWTEKENLISVLQA